MIGATAYCQDFEGSGGAPYDRYLVVEPGKTWNITGNLYTSTGAEMPNFKVKLQDGSSGDLTEVLVAQNVTAIDFVPASDNDVGDYIELDVEGTVTDSSIALRDYGTLEISGGLVDTKVNVGNPAGSSGSASTVTIISGISGLPELKLRGHTQMTTYGGDITATGANDRVELREYSEITVPWEETLTVEGGSWLLTDHAQFNAADVRIFHGDWTVEGSASVQVGVLRPDTLRLDGDLVTVISGFVGREVGSTTYFPWDLTLWDSAALTAWDSAAFTAGFMVLPEVDNVQSSLSFGGQGQANLLTAGKLEMWGSMIAQAPAALKLDIYQDLSLATRLVRSLSGVTTITPFAAELVDLTMVEHPTVPTNLEVFCPDYDLSTDGPLFVDSPCVRRWNKVTAADNPNNSDGVVLRDAFSSTPISGGTTASPGSGLQPEALYAKDLVVNSGAILRVSPGVGTPNLNIYYTGTVTNNGSILDLNGNAYTPIKLIPTMYGDFDADGEGNETSDVNRFNAAFPSTINDPEYDMLVDFDCDGDIDCDDRTQYVNNWDPAGIENCPE